MWLSILIPILLTILVIVCLLLTLVVLMQRPKSEGLGAAFGSGMTENIFGAQTTSVLTKATAYLGGTLFTITLLLTILTARQSTARREGLLESEARTARPVASPAAPAATANTPGVAASASPEVQASPPSAATSPSPAAVESATPAPAPSAGVSPEAPATPVPSPQP